MERPDFRASLRDRKKIVVKVGSSTITYPNTGDLNLMKLERFVRVLIDLRNSGRHVVVVSSGAVAAGRRALGQCARGTDLATRQACAAVGQARLMMVYEKLFAEYGILTAQLLLSKESVLNDECAAHALNTFNKLAEMDVVPIVNENDAISVDEFRYGRFGENDTLAAIVAKLISADLLVLMSDIEGMYTDDPHADSNARMFRLVTRIGEVEDLAKGAGSSIGSGGMTAKINAARIAVGAGVDMAIVSGEDVTTLRSVADGEDIGTLFVSNRWGYDGPNEF